VVVVNLVNPKPDCSAVPGPVALPGLREKPTNGTIQVRILVADVPAAGNCLARKIPAIALTYTPNKDFVGADSVQVEVGNRTTLLSYRLVVLPAAQSL
jgi:hypothetical protein